MKRGAWDLFFKQDGDFEALMRYGSEEVQNKIPQIKALLKDGCLFNFLQGIGDAMTDINRQHQDCVTQLYTNLSQARLLSLKQAIENGIQAHAKVIVLMTRNFIPQNPCLGKEVELQFIGSYLKTKKFAIIHAKQACLNELHQPELWPKHDPLLKFKSRGCGFDREVKSARKNRKKRKINFGPRFQPNLLTINEENEKEENTRHRCAKYRNRKD